MLKARDQGELSVRRLARTFQEPASSVGRWIKAPLPKPLDSSQRVCPVSGDPELRQAVRELCNEPRNRRFGYRFIWALLRRRKKIFVSKKTVWRIMHEMKLVQPKIWRRPMRPKRVEKMRPTRPNEAWQIDMTSFQLPELTPMFLVTVIDCFTRQIVGWTLDRRCRASEWTSALRVALEAKGLSDKETCRKLTLRSDNGAQPCSKAFVEYLGKTGVKGQYTGYNAPDDNAYVERVIRTIKEEEIWPNEYDTVSEARKAIEDYVTFYNEERPHSALDYRTPNEAEADAKTTLVAA